MNVNLETCTHTKEKRCAIKLTQAELQIPAWQWFADEHHGVLQARSLSALGKARGLAPQLEGMQQELAALDAMWDTVKAPKATLSRAKQVGSLCNITASCQCLGLHVLLRLNVQAMHCLTRQLWKCPSVAYDLFQRRQQNVNCSGGKDILVTSMQCTTDT